MAYFVILLVLLALGIWLFVQREHKMATRMTHEVSIHAEPSTRRIVNDQYLILTKNEAVDLAAILEPLGLEISMPLLNWTLVSKKGQKDYKELPLGSPEAEDDRLVLRSLSENSHILAAVHNFVLDPASLPLNPTWKKEWQLHQASRENPSGMDLPHAWDLTTGSRSISIAIIDDFLYKQRFSFADRFAPCTARINFVNPFSNLLSPEAEPKLHSELMLLALGACTDTGSSSAGIDWQAKLVAVQRASPGYAQSFLSALYASGIDVCTESQRPCTKALPDQALLTAADVVLMPFATNAPELLHFTIDMIGAMAEKNVSLVAAAGNNDQQASLFLPGSSPRAINIGALNAKGERASFSNWGPTLDILAPGQAINFLYSNGPKMAEGSSIAAAYGAGVAALMRAINPQLRPEAVKFLLKQSGRALSCDDYCKGVSPDSCKPLCCTKTAVCGSRSLDAFTALELAQRPTLDAPLIKLDQHYVLMFRAQAAPARITISNLGDRVGEVRAVIYDSNLIVEPAEFSLSPRGSTNSAKEVLLSFKREPFARHTFKIEFITYYEGQAIDTTELYVEYVSRR